MTLCCVDTSANAISDELLCLQFRGEQRCRLAVSAGRVRAFAEQTPTCAASEFTRRDRTTLTAGRHTTRRPSEGLRRSRRSSCLLRVDRAALRQTQILSA